MLSLASRDEPAGPIRKYRLRIRAARVGKVFESTTPFPNISVGDRLMWDDRWGEDVETVFHRFYEDGTIHEMDIWLKGSAPF
ncbi:hypothetical protein [Brevundimonas vesicularis]|jgi:hypothetical protein|uniref:hypothetical protein n=1 Tax=Brevundimonas vesicularis TaxID=41276 RepID=UPI00384D43EC